MKNFLKTNYIHTVKKKLLFAIILGVLVTAGFGVFFIGNSESYAAGEISIELNGNIIDPGVPIQMTTSSITLILKSTDNIYNDATSYAINWSIESAEHRRRATITNGSSSIYGVLTALEPGEVQIAVSVVDKTTAEQGIVASATCTVDIVFSIDTLHDDNNFKFLYDTDTARSLIRHTNDDPYDLKLAFGSPENCQWTVENDEVVSVDDDGVVTPVGAGHTNVVANYTPSGDTKTYTAFLPVYVFPRISLDNSTYFTGGTYGMATGDTIFTDAFFGPVNTESIQEKLTWVIKKDVGGVRTVIEDSLGNKKSDLVEITTLDGSSNTSSLELSAKAGNYYIEFYPTGAYKSEAVKTTVSPTVLNLTVYAEFENYDKTILVNDAFNIADSFNLTTEDFLNLFSLPTIVLNGGGDASNYVSYSSDTSIVSALQKGTVIVTVNGKNGKENNIGNLCNPDKISKTTTFNLTLRIIDSFTLDRTSVVLNKNQTLQLTPTFTSYSGIVSWESSDSKYVTVTDGGLIRAIKETSVGSDIVITATLKLDDGTIKKASCVVKVEGTIDKITLSPDSLTMQKGETRTVIAKFNGNVTIAPFTWTTTDPKVCTVSPASDGKSCLVTAVNGGIATVILTNIDNQVQVYCPVTVTVPIEKIQLAETEIKAKLYTDVTKLKYSYEPSNATDLRLVWTSSDPSVAKIDSTGLVTFVAPGTTLINVYPENNPNNTYSQCMLTIMKTADSMSLTANDITLNAGETFDMNYTVMPEGSDLMVSFSSIDPTIATVDSITGLITAKRAGTTQIFAKGEGLDVPMTCAVHVLQKSTAISFSQKEIVIKTDESATLTTSIKPADSTDTLTWNSLDSKIAKVTDGVVTGVAAGTTYIQVKTSSGPDSLITVYVRDPVKALALDKSEATMTVGDKLTLLKTFTPANPYNQAVKWSTSNGSVATVDEKGVVTATGGGIVVIKCTSDDGGYQATCIVTVKEPVASMSLNYTSYKLGIGKKITLKATITNSNASNKGVTWSSSNSKIATVNSSGKVTGKKVGKCTIKAVANDGSGMSATCSIRVVKRVTKITLNKKTASIFTGKSFKLKKTIKPKTATIKSVKWSSSDKEVATVDKSGNVLGISPGIARITVTANDGSGKSAACLVTVKEKIVSTGITAAKSEVTIAIGTAANVAFTVEPSDSTDKVKYISDNSNVASVNARGKIYGKAIGSATIYATTSSGSSATIDVYVVGLNRHNTRLRIYDAETLWVNGFDKNVKWYSENALIASVVNGKVVGRKPGRTRVYAVVNGTKIACNVVVTKLD